MDEQENIQRRPLPQRQGVEIQQTQDVKVSTATWILMFGTALFFDAGKALLQIIPIMGQILAIMVGWFAFATFWLWFKLIGAKYSRKTMIIGFVTDFIPVLDVLSETGTILALYLQSKAEKVIPGADLVSKKFKKVA